MLNGQGQMISPLDVYQTLGQTMQVDEYISKYEAENKKMKNLESDLEKLQIVIKDKDKIISLYEVIANNKTGLVQETFNNQQTSFGT